MTTTSQVTQIGELSQSLIMRNLFSLKLILVSISMLSPWTPTTMAFKFSNASQVHLKPSVNHQRQLRKNREEKNQKTRGSSPSSLSAFISFQPDTSESSRKLPNADKKKLEYFDLFINHHYDDDHYSLSLKSQKNRTFEGSVEKQYSHYDQRQKDSNIFNALSPFMSFELPTHEPFAINELQHDYHHLKSSSLKSSSATDNEKLWQQNSRNLLSTTLKSELKHSPHKTNSAKQQLQHFNLDSLNSLSAEGMSINGSSLLVDQHHYCHHHQKEMHEHHKQSNTAVEDYSMHSKLSLSKDSMRHAINELSHVLTLQEMSPFVRFTNNDGKTKILNLFGLYNLFILIVTIPIWILSMNVVQYLGDHIIGFDDNRSKFDLVGKIWCRTYLGLVDCYPEIAGNLSRLKMREKNRDYYRNLEDKEIGACLFVANHASYLDIPVLCTVLSPVFKFIAKDSLRSMPGVGQQLVGGNHMLIDRTDKRSQLQTFKQALSYLQKGIPIMAFPEGARSIDGRLMSFKPGLFAMAVKAKVPIIPLSIANTHAVMPSMGILPVQRGRGKMRVFVHDPIDVNGKSEDEIVIEVRQALLSQLPLDQHPLEE